jgi:hypothetical protein
MTPKAKFNLLLEPEQLAALRDIQAVSGATVAEQIRRAIADWIAARHVPTQSPEALYAALKELADAPWGPEPGKQEIHRKVRAAERSLRKTLIKERELAAIERGERTEKEIGRFVGKASRTRKS